MIKKQGAKIFAAWAQRKNEKWISEGSPIAEKVVSFGDVTIRKFPGIGVDKPYMVKHARGTHLSEPIFITHGSGFNEIVPCGLNGHKIGKISNWLPNVRISEVRKIMKNNLRKHFGLLWS